MQSLYRDYERALLVEELLVDARKIAQERLDEAILVTNELARARQREDAMRQLIARLQIELERTQLAFAGAVAGVESRLRFRESWKGWMRGPLHRLRSSLTGARDS
jgi:hypothetical protein